MNNSTQINIYYAARKLIMSSFSLFVGGNKKCSIAFVLLLLMNFIDLQSYSQKISSNYLLVIHTYNANGVPQKAQEYIKYNDLEGLDNDALNFAIAENYYLLKDYRQAANLFFVINKKDKDMANYELARCYAHIGNPDMAAQHLRAHLESKNKLMLRTINDEEAFMPIYKSVEWKKLWETEWYSKYDRMYEEAWMQYDYGNFEDALQLLDRLTSIRKSMVEALYLKSLVYLKLNEPKNALILINEAIDKREKIAKFYALQAKVELELNKESKALQSINTAIAMDSNQIDYYFLRATAYMKSGKLDLAVSDLEDLISLVPNFDVYKLAAEIYNEGEEYQNSIKAYNKCIEMQKYNPDLYIARGDVYIKMAAYEFAEGDYTFSLDFKPFDGELYYKRGIARKMQHKTEGACQDFHKSYNYKFMKADDELRGYCQGR